VQLGLIGLNGEILAIDVKELTMALYDGSEVPRTAVVAIALITVPGAIFGKEKLNLPKGSAIASAKGFEVDT